MTLILAATLPEGIVLTADSRQSYVNRSGLPRIASDNATKIVAVTQTVVIASSGSAFFSDAGRLRSIQSYIREFGESLANAMPNTILELAQALEHFWQQNIERIVRAQVTQAVTNEHGNTLVFQPIANGQLPYSYVGADGQPKASSVNLAQVGFMVIGRDADNTCHAISVSPYFPMGPHSTTNGPNLQWIGDSSVVNKLLTGNDPFIISSATMTVQDAIDFCIILTRTTENIQKFSDGTAGSQGGVPSVGGPIDIIYLPRIGELTWVSEKRLHSEVI